MAFMRDAITLTNAERMELTRRATSRTDRAEGARRARVILLLAEGHTWDEISERIDCSRGFVASWAKRFAEQRVAGLYSRHIGQVATVLTAELEARILEATRHAPSGSTHWTTRKLAAHLGISHMMVARVWRKHGLKPHQIERYMASNDPDFEKKAADIIGLYLNPPAHAAVFCVDEKTHIQALDRKDPVLPLSPGRAERHGFEYYRHGTLSLYAAFNTKTGEVLGKTAERHTSAEFVAFLTDIVINQPRGKEIHVIADNLSVNRTPICGHHELREALSMDGRFGRLRRTGNRPAVVNALLATATMPQLAFGLRRASAARIALAAHTQAPSACAPCCSSQCTR